MPEQTQDTFVPDPLPPTQPPSEITLPVDKVTIINIDDIKPNSIIVISTVVESLQQKLMAVSKILAPYSQTLREKKVSVMFMPAGDNLTVLSEEAMNAAGWEKKAKSLIINPFEK